MAGPRGELSPPLGDVARLLLPPGGHALAVGDWSLRELEAAGADQIVWGEGPASGPRRVAAAGRRTLQRETALLRLRVRGPGGWRLLRVHRLAPWGPPSDRVRGLLRHAVRGGTLVELAHGPARARVLDLVVEGAAIEPTGPPRPGAGGGLLQAARWQQRPAILRVGLSGSPADPTWAAEGLERLAAVDEVPAPAALGRGRHGPAGWTREARLHGRAPPRLTPRLLASVVGAFTAMPVTTADAAGAGRRDLRRLAVELPAHAGRLRALEPALDVLSGSAPAVVGHGDLWAGNLLQEGGDLTGIVDWDAWCEDTAPGTDLLQLFATAWRMRLGVPLGAIWRRRPWRHPTFAAAMSGYWRHHGLRPGAAELEALGVAWWAREVAGTLVRFPSTRDDAAWIAANVDPVLADAPAG